MPVQRPPPAGGAALRDTLDAVLRSGAFRASLWEQVTALARDLFARALRALGAVGDRSSAAFWALAAAAAAVLVWLAARAYERRAARRRAALAAAGIGAEDAGAAAERAAAAGDYRAAAHLLYAAAVGALARRGLVRPRASKTAGDYAREAWRRGPAGGAPAAFARFARGYEAVAFGPRAPDRAAYEALRAAAAPVLAPELAPGLAAGPGGPAGGGERAAA